MTRRRCTYCYEAGHNRRTCEKLKKYVENNPDSWTAKKYSQAKARRKTTRTCSYCETSGHNRRSCALLKADKKVYLSEQIKYRKETLDYLRHHGIGVGALVEYSHPRVGYLAYDECVHGKEVAINSYNMIPAYSMSQEELDIPWGYISDIDWNDYKLGFSEYGTVRVCLMNRKNLYGKEYILDTQRAEINVVSRVDSDLISPPKGWIHNGEAEMYFNKDRKRYQSGWVARD
jgi:hypothetical protein